MKRLLPRNLSRSSRDPLRRQAFTIADLDPYILQSADRARWQKVVAQAVNEGLFVTPPGLTDTIEMPGNHGGTNWA